MEKTFVRQICDELCLGELTEEPQRLSGGFLHKMYSVFTTKGKYAVKLLNPFIMQRETAMGNFKMAEYFEEILEKAELPILPAMKYKEKKMQEIEGQYFYVFAWFDGKAIKPIEITVEHAGKIGDTLARIHALGKIENGDKTDEVCIDWSGYTEKLLQKDEVLGLLLAQNVEFLEKLQTAANKAIKKLSPMRTICHNDMDPKNVLWSSMDHRVIDLECLGYADPRIELIETALCWSGLDDCRIDTDLFSSFFRAYAEAGGEIPKQLRTVFDANCGRLYWLEYCVQRALGMNCSEEEHVMGKRGVYTTLRQLHCIEDVWGKIDDIVKKEFSNK